MVVGLCLNMPVFIHIEWVIVLAAHHLCNLKTSTKFQALYSWNAENQLCNGVFQSLKHRGTNASRHIDNRTFNQTTQRFTALASVADVLLHDFTLCIVDDCKWLFPYCQNIGSGNVCF